MLEGVEHEVEDDLLELLLLAGDMGQPGLELGRHRDIAAGQLMALELEGGADDLVEVDENASGLVTLAENGERAHAPGRALPLLFDDAGVAVGVLERRAHPDHGAARDQRGQRIGDFMGDIREESPQHHHPVARDESPLLGGELRAEIADLGLEGPREERQPGLP